MFYIKSFIILYENSNNNLNDLEKVRNVLMCNNGTLFFDFYIYHKLNLTARHLLNMCNKLFNYSVVKCSTTDCDIYNIYRHATVSYTITQTLHLIRPLILCK